MPLTAHESTFTHKPMPSGMQAAICVGVVDLGTQSGFGGKDQHKVLLVWETPEIRANVEREGQTVSIPRTINATYTLSLAENANLRRMLESWRGRGFTPEELKGFDIRRILGKACYVQIFEEVSKAGRPYSAVRNVLQIPKTLAPLRAETPLMYFSFEDLDPSNPVLPPVLPEWLQGKIRESPEWRDLTTPNQAVAAPREDDGEPPITDDLPF